MTKAERVRIKFKELLQKEKTVVIPGVHDPIAAKLAEQIGFPTVYVGSYATAAARFGLPDVGIVTMTEMVAHANGIANAVDVPVIADGENGWNNAANIWRTIHEFEDAGICGIHIEDHEFGKHASVSPILASEEATAQKIRAAVAARRDPNFLIIARTDVPWATGDLEEAARRLNSFTEAGADLVMPAGILPKQLAYTRKAIKGQVVMTDKPGYSVEDEENCGASVVLYYGFTLYAAYYGMKTALKEFKKTPDADAVPHIRDQIKEFEDFIGYPDFATRAKTYSSG